MSSKLIWHQNWTNLNLKKMKYHQKWNDIQNVSHQTWSVTNKNVINFKMSLKSNFYQTWNVTKQKVHQNWNDTKTLMSLKQKILNIWFKIQEIDRHCRGLVLIMAFNNGHVIWFILMNMIKVMVKMKMITFFMNIMFINNK